MKVLNIHERVINQPISKVAALFETLSSKNDLILAHEKWSAMRLDKGLRKGSKGGHGPIRYTVAEYTPKRLIQFRFSKPVGFDGFHQLEINKYGDSATQLRHTVKMNTSGMSAIS